MNRAEVRRTIKKNHEQFAKNNVGLKNYEASKDLVNMLVDANGFTEVGIAVDCYIQLGIEYVIHDGFIVAYQ